MAATSRYLLNMADSQKIREARFYRWVEWGGLALLCVQFFHALSWVAKTWTDSTYDSWGFIAFVVLVWRLRRLPARRTSPDTRYLFAVLLIQLCDLFLMRLGVNFIGALFAVFAFQFWLLAFRQYRGRFYAQPELLLALLLLPVAFWVDVVLGYPLQRLVCVLAASSLKLYGLPVEVAGTLLRLPETTIAVDSVCSGTKFLMVGIVFGLFVQPKGGLKRRLLFWLSLPPALVLANTLRVVSLSMAEIQFGYHLGHTLHQLVGIVAFALVCGFLLGVPLLMQRRTLAETA
jgi:exosortase